MLTITRGHPRARGFELDRLRPLGTVGALIDWPLPPGDGDDAIAPDTASLLCRALLRSGNAAFRWDGGVPPGGGRFFPEPPRSLAAKLRGLLVTLDRDARFGAVATGAEAAARHIFAWDGWKIAMQAVLVHDPAVDVTPIVAALQHGLDWRGRFLPPGARLLFGSGHDGGFAWVAAGSEELLTRFLADVAAELAVAAS